MIRAEYKDKDCIVKILSQSFADNKSVNYIIKQDKKRAKRIQRLMEYSFEVCFQFGEVFLSDDKKGCALILFPDKKKNILRSILLDAGLIISSISLSNIKKVLDRESRIKKFHPKELMYYLWYIGVEPALQNKGIGGNLLKEVIENANSIGRKIYLETSTLQNIPWYKKFGFKIYHEFDFDYPLYFMKRE